MPQKRAHFIELADHVVIGVKDELSGEILDVVGEFARVVHRRVVVQTVLQADFIVFLAVAGGDMHGAGSRVQRDERRQNEHAVPFDQRVQAFLAFEHRALKLVEDCIRLAAPSESLQTIVEHVFGDDEDLRVDFDRRVNEIVLHRNGQIGGNGPGRGGPDDHGHFFTGQFGPHGADIGIKSELDVNRRRVMIRVFHFRFGQRRFARCAPVHRLLSLVNAAVEIKLAELRDGGGFIRIRHGQIGIVPLAENSQTFELRALDVDEFFGVHAAGAALFHLRQAGFLAAQFLVDLVFDGQTVAVPPRHEHAVEAGHVLGLDDNVLDDFIERRAQMDVAVGVRRAVVQDIRRAAFGRRPDFAVNIHFFPFFKHLRLALGQIGFHRKIGLGKIQRLFVIHGAAPVFFFRKNSG